MTSKLLFLTALIPLLLVPLVNAVPAISITLFNDLDSQNFVQIGKPLLYVNGTNYHVKETLKSVAEYTYPFVTLNLNFLDKKSGSLINTAAPSTNDTVIHNMSPNQTGHFDMDTGYTKAQGDKEFPYFNITIGVVV